MATIEYSKDKGTYFSVLGDGKFHQTVDSKVEGAVLREYETSDGKKGSKYELLAQSISGRITGVSIFDGNFGKNVQVIFGNDEKPDDTIIVSLSAQGNYGEDFLKKLPNIDASKDVKLSPYAFEDDNGKKKKGMTVYQGDTKVQNYYSEENKKTKKWTLINGYPKPEGKTDTYDSDDWKLYYAGARKFLLTELKKHPLYVEDVYAVKDADQSDDITVESIPL